MTDPEIEALAQEIEAIEIKYTPYNKNSHSQFQYNRDKSPLEIIEEAASIIR